MGTREVAYNIFNSFDETQLKGFIALFGNVVSDVPNEETLAAMEEAEAMLKDPNAKKYDSVDELFEELQS